MRESESTERTNDRSYRSLKKEKAYHKSKSNEIIIVKNIRNIISLNIKISGKYFEEGINDTNKKIKRKSIINT
jgi:hypothetical protein